MKHAKVVAADIAAPAPQPADARVLRIVDLLRRQPSLTPEQVKEVCHYLTTGPLAEVGRFGADHGVERELAHFRRDHARLLGPGVIRPIIMIAATLGPAAFLAWSYLV